jgi:hypothetical protein
MRDTLVDRARGPHSGSPPTRGDSPVAPPDARLASPGDQEEGCAEVTDALEAAVEEVRRAGTSAPLDASPFATRVREFAAAVRAAGVPPERMVVLLRHCVEETPGLPRDQEARQAIWWRALQWALEAYYSAR